MKHTFLAAPEPDRMRGFAMAGAALALLRCARSKGQHMRIATLLATTFGWALATLSLAPSATAASVDWSEAFALQARGAGLDPAVLVGFDPQPEPPGA